MSTNIPSDLRYTEQHEWVRREGDFIIVGITDHAQRQLGDIVFVDIPDKDEEFAQGDELGTLESVKAVAEFYAPVSGTLVEKNAELDASPEDVNTDPYGDGWMVTIKPSDPKQLDGLLDAEAYRKLTEQG